jgi:DNA-binding YbaB/EbfC family protein
MFNQLGQMAKVMAALPKFREEMERLQQRLGDIVAEGDAGAGMVKVRVNGRFEMAAVVLSEEALALKDREMLEDMIKAANNQAIERVRQQVADETSKMATSFGMPPGMNLPGMP